MSSAGSSPISRGSGHDPGPDRAARPRPRHARPGGIRPRDGVQRHVGVGRDRERRPDDLSRQAVAVRPGGSRPPPGDVAVRLPRSAAARADAARRRARALPRRSRDRPGRERREALVRRRTAERAAVRVREARALPLGLRAPREASCAAHAGRSDQADRDRHGRVLRRDRARAGSRHHDRDRGHGRRRAAGVRGADAAVRPLDDARARHRRRRDLGGALPPRAVLQLPASDRRPPGCRLPDPAGDDQRRLRAHPGRGSRARHRIVLLPARGPHGHDRGDHRRRARSDRADAARRCVRGLRLGRVPDRAHVPRPVRQAARGRGHDVDLRPGRDQPRSRAGRGAADGDSAPVRLLWRLVADRAPHRGRRSP